MSTVTRKQTFNVASPGFAYTVVVGILVILTALGVHFPSSEATLAGDIITTFSKSGIYSIIGIIVASIIFPIYNAVKDGSFQWSKFKGSTLTWVALLNILLGALAIFGFVLPDGSAEQIIGAVQSKDWIALGGFIFTTVVPTLVRWIKDRNKAKGV